MIWIILAALGIPLWMVLGALTATVVSRRRFRRQPGVFAAKLRGVSGDNGRMPTSWKRRCVYVRWVHDVLLVQHGLALAQTLALPVSGAENAVTVDDPAALKGLGPDALVLRLHLDSGATVELAASATARDTLAGPFAGQ